MKNKNIDGIKVSKVLFEELKKYLDNHKIKPTIVDISIGNDFGGLVYSRMKKKIITHETGIRFESIHYDKISKDDIVEYIRRLNEDNSVNGIMLQLPLPESLAKDEREILDTISPMKDVDGLTTVSIGRLSVGLDTFVSCTALGIEVLLKVYNIELKGRKVAIISRSNIVGKPLAQLMLRNNATPIICHSQTSNLKEVTRDCDIVVVALNRNEFITGEYIGENSIIIDVGVHKNEEGKIVGDVCYDDAVQKAKLITPPVGAVGPMTICMLAYNVAKSVYGDEVSDVLEKGLEKARDFVE